MSLAWSVFVFFISLMHPVNGAKFLSITFFFLLPRAAGAPVFRSVIVLLTRMCASL